MPGRSDIQTAAGLCRRCKENEATVNVRSEPLCRSVCPSMHLLLLLMECRGCFGKYVHTKVVKRMETFRTKYAPETPERTLLLPLSFGVSSTSLLHVLDHHLESQLQKSGRAAYALHVLYVDSAAVDGRESYETKLEHAKQRFPRHNYSSIPISDAMDLPETSSLLPQDDGNEETPAASRNERLGIILSTATSPTARTDILSSLQTSLVVNFAKRHNCTAILWGDSTTRLAEKTLASTAKGRGFALPYITPEDSTLHSIRFQYPLRDLLKKELIAYAENSAEPPLTDLIVRDVVKTVSISARNTTIDDLMTQYFESVEKEYPSIVANVVRTAGKLEMPRLEGNEDRCRLCSVPSQRDVRASERHEERGQDVLCRTCARSIAIPA